MHIFTVLEHMVFNQFCAYLYVCIGPCFRIHDELLEVLKNLAFEKEIIFSTGSHETLIFDDTSRENGIIVNSQYLPKPNFLLL